MGRVSLSANPSDPSTKEGLEVVFSTTGGKSLAAALSS
eukprot:CAMPEP_0171618712 /NCGR_PEP_ID=MMETSP0990-20121206/14919_1 /TAXON_ID=483369 /ORGANISM="non described non described, Strain CCMP2098" /LENGTH=37 /DNA_ID= /DNA_START= /DNA_END= /DNA_ORIENTATION=